MGDHAAPQHQCVAARCRAAAAGIVYRPDVTIRHHRNVDGFPDVMDARPVSGRAVAIRLGAGVHHDFGSPGLANSQRAFHGPAVIVKTQPHLGRHGLVRGHGTPYGRHNFYQQLRLVQQGRAAAVAVHHLGRTTKIQIYAHRAQAGQAGGVFGQANRVRTKQLRPHRHACQRAPPIEQLGHHAD